MSAALQEIRAAKVEAPAEVVEAKPVEAAAEPAAVVDDKAKEPDPKAAAEPPAAAEETPEQLLAKQKAELHRVNTEIGRVNALNRLHQEDRQKIADLERELQSARKPPETPSEAMAELGALRERVKDFPELSSLVEVVDKALKEVESKAQAHAKQAAQDAIAPLEPLRQHHQVKQEEEQTAANAAALTVFNDTYRTAREVVQTDDFKTWLPKQSQAIQWAFFKGKTPADAMPVMDAYDAFLRRSGKPSIAHTPQLTQQPPAAAEPKPNDRLARAAGIPSRATGGAKGALPPQDDFEGSLEFFRQQRQNKLARAAA